VSKEFRKKRKGLEKREIERDEYTWIVHDIMALLTAM